MHLDKLVSKKFKKKRVFFITSFKINVLAKLIGYLHFLTNISSPERTGKFSNMSYLKNQCFNCNGL